jgi:hypothetical protein
MAYVPLSGYLTQLITQTGQVASDYYIKFYLANTTTPLSMATDQGAGTLLVKAKFNNNGMPISNPLDNSTEFIPHLNQAYRLVVYTSEAEADANDTASSYVNIPEIYPLLSASNIGTDSDQIPLNSNLGTASLVNTGTGAGNVPLNSNLGTASLVNTGTAAGEAPLNSNLGTASLVNTGLLTGNVPTADQLSMVGETVNYTGANLNPNVFGGADGVIQIGTRRNATNLRVCLTHGVQDVSAGISVGTGDFVIRDESFSTVDTITSTNISIVRSALGTVYLNCEVSGGLIANEIYTLNSVSVDSTIEVVNT